jgi:hypothetical protein
MKLMTKELENQIPKLYAQDGKGDNAIVCCKYFDPFGFWNWYVTEFDPKDRLFFGLVQGFETELGYFSLDELEGLGGRIERDLYFQPKTLGELKKELRMESDWE